MAANWLAALGAGALEGSKFIRANRAEDEEKRRFDAARKMDLARMALMEEDALRSQALFDRNMARDVIETAGPGGMVDPAAAETIRQGGLGFRLREQEGMLPSKQFTPDATGEGVEQIAVPGQEAGITVVPTAREQAALDAEAETQQERDRQKRFRSIVESPQFLAQPQPKRQLIWTAAGYPGRVPETFEEQKELIDYQHGLEMQKIRTMYPTDRFGGAGRGRNSDEQLYFQNIDKIADNVRAEYSSVIQAAAQAGDWQKVQQLQNEMRALVKQQVEALPVPQSLQVAQGPELNDPGSALRNYLMSHPGGSVISQNIGNPQFIEELKAEDPQTYSDLVSMGAITEMAPPPQAPAAPVRRAPLPIPPTHSPLLDEPATRTPGGKVRVTPLQHQLLQLEDDRRRLREMGLVP